MEFHIGKNSSWFQNDRLELWKVGFHVILIEPIESNFRAVFKLRFENVNIGMIETKSVIICIVCAVDRYLQEHKTTHL